MAQCFARDSECTSTVPESTSRDSGCTSSDPESTSRDNESTSTSTTTYAATTKKSRFAMNLLPNDYALTVSTWLRTM